MRVGGPAWELKIDAERLQETEKNEEEEESGKRRETSAYIWPEKGPPTKFLIKKVKKFDLEIYMDRRR